MSDEKAAAAPVKLYTEQELERATTSAWLDGASNARRQFNYSKSALDLAIKSWLGNPPRTEELLARAKAFEEFLREASVPKPASEV